MHVARHHHMLLEHTWNCFRQSCRMQIDDDGRDELNMELSQLARLSPKEIE